ncbi:MAG TPA: sigma-70 family RNA polymerase sigma factor [Candidatus Dormibacteraeota bacterium]|nr:sigma-70 family RNA polymerase sigma factor [Candidatus Dormibacteraeota bacterium]
MHAQAGAEALPVTGIPDARALAAGQLIRQATGGDLTAFEEVVRRMQRRVYGFAYQHLRDLDEAHDLTQEIFVKLYRNLARYDADRPFEPWFWKLAANTTINYRRKRVPMPTDQSADQRLSGDESPPSAHDPVLVDALAQLDPAYRLPILLHYYADLPLAQVAQSLNLSVPATKSRLHRARALLRNSLAEAEEAGPQ